MGLRGDLLAQTGAEVGQTAVGVVVRAVGENLHPCIGEGLGCGLAPALRGLLLAELGQFVLPVPATLLGVLGVLLLRGVQPVGGARDVFYRLKVGKLHQVERVPGALLQLLRVEFGGLPCGLQRVAAHAQHCGGAAAADFVGAEQFELGRSADRVAVRHPAALGVLDQRQEKRFAVGVGEVVAHECRDARYGLALLGGFLGGVDGGEPPALTLEHPVLAVGERPDADRLLNTDPGHGRQQGGVRLRAFLAGVERVDH